MHCTTESQQRGNSQKSTTTVLDGRGGEGGRAKPGRLSMTMYALCHTTVGASFAVTGKLLQHVTGTHFKSPHLVVLHVPPPFPSPSQ